MNPLRDEINFVKQSLTQNRAEHIGVGNDVWRDFVFPRFLSRVIIVSDMPARIEGGRGSGKTMLLRYLSYESQFSEHRRDVPKDAHKRIGLYWKADTQFLRTMEKRGLAEAEWILIFDHYITLKLAADVVHSIYKISNSNFAGLTKPEVDSASLRSIEDYGFSSGLMPNVLEEISSRIRRVELAIQNIEGAKELHKLPSNFLVFLINAVKAALPVFAESSFGVFIDEYENLASYQQRIINTKIKHSEPPLVFNIAIKLNGMSETATLSEEKLQNRADYKIVSLDRELKDEFDVFVAEIFLKKIVDSSSFFREKLGFENAESTDLIFSNELIDSARGKEAIALCRSLLPGRTFENLAEEIFSTPIYFAKLEKEIGRALVARGEKRRKVSDFIDTDQKKASVVCSVLLYRENLKVDDVYSNFDRLRKGESNKFEGKTAWVHNNFIGSYLRIITAFRTNSSFYSGFDVFTFLANGNVRHFLEICRTAFNLVNDEYLIDKGFVDQKTQHMAARISSEELFSEIKSFTPNGLQLYQFVSGLGLFFQLLGARESQSEPEITHFGIVEKSSCYREEVERFLLEAEKWDILKALDATKNKSGQEGQLVEYVLNPIYSPRFLLTYRKNRKTSISVDDIRGLYTLGTAHVPNMKAKYSLSGDEDINPEQGKLL